MKSHRNDPNAFKPYLFDLKPSHYHHKHRDSIPIPKLNAELNGKRRDTSSHLDTFLNYRSTLDRNSSSSNATKKYLADNGLLVNGLLFDGQLFQPMQPSYVIDYENASEGLNRYFEAHKAESKCSPLDDHLFKCAFILTLSDGFIEKEHLIEYCPSDDSKEHILEEMSHYKRFCFPELGSTQKNSGMFFNDQSTYVFTRTLVDGQVEYGYCQRLGKIQNKIPKFPIVFCIVSAHSYFKLYDAILNELLKVYKLNESRCGALMQLFYSKQLPTSTLNSSSITCTLNDHRIFYYICSRDDRLNHDYFITLLSCLSPKHIVDLFDAMLCSKRIIVFSRYPSKLTKCSLALILLLYPFVWPYPFVSLMPSVWLSDLVDSPCPFIYGCLHETARDLQLTNDHDITQVDLDINSVKDLNYSGHLLPRSLRHAFENSLDYIIKYRAMKANTNLINTAVSEACLTILTELFYRLPEFCKAQETPLKNNSNEKSDSGLSSIKNDQNPTDPQSSDSIDLPSEASAAAAASDEYIHDDNQFNYDFNTQEFLRVQPPSYAQFLSKFMQGMIFLKFLDDYHSTDNTDKDVFSLFTQRLQERRRRTPDELSMSITARFRRTLDLLAKQIKQASKQPNANPSFSKYIRKFLEYE